MDLSAMIHLVQKEPITVRARLRNISVIPELAPTNLHCWYDCYEIEVLEYAQSFLTHLIK